MSALSAPITLCCGNRTFQKRDEIADGLEAPDAYLGYI
jgi:hypothetical protein